MKRDSPASPDYIIKERSWCEQNGIDYDTVSTSAQLEELGYNADQVQLPVHSCNAAHLLRFQRCEFCIILF